jgi:hypothetical protein
VELKKRAGRGAEKRMEQEILILLLTETGILVYNIH